MSQSRIRPAKVAARVLDEAIAGTVVVNTVKGALGWVIPNARQIGRAAVRTFGPWVRLNILPEDVTNAEERFEMAARIAALDSRSGDPEVEHRVYVAGRRFELYSYAALAMFAAIIISLGSPIAANFFLGQRNHALSELMVLILGLMFVAQAMKVSFWSTQLRRRALIPFIEWLRNPSDWIPPDAPVHRQVLRVIPWIIPIGLLAVPHRVMAQAVSSSTESAQSILQSLLGDLNSTDLSLQWMERLFPSAISQSGVSYSSDAVAQMFFTMNTVLLGVAGAMVTWHTISGLVATATDGTVLGDRWHTTWAPIRLFVGIGSTVPISGYCAAQLLAIQIILAGYGLANTGWTTYLAAATGMTNGQEAYVVAPVMSDQEGLFNTAIEAQTCLDLAEVMAGSAGNASTAASTYTAAYGIQGEATFAQPTETTNSDGSVTFNWGSVCGSVTFPAPPGTEVVTENGVTDPTTGTAGVSDEGINFTEGTANSTVTSAQTSFYSARVSAFQTFLGSIDGSSSGQLPYDLAELNAPNGTATAGNTSILTTDYANANSAFQTYLSSVSGAAATMATSMNSGALTSLNSEGTALGWASAGAIQSQLVTLNQVAASAANSAIESTGVNFDVLGDGGSELSTHYNDAIASMSAAVAGEASLGAVGTPGTSASTTTGVPTISTAAFISALKSGGDPMKAIGQAMGGGNEYTLLLNNGLATLNPMNPMGDMIEEGEWLKGAGYVLMGAEALITGTSNAIANGSNEGLLEKAAGFLPGAGISKVIAYGILGVVTAIGSFILSLAAMMVLIGVALEVILPLLQYLVWMTAVAAVIVFAVEVVVGAAFWAFAHVRMDGSEFANQQQAYGYGILLNCVFRPLLMVVGLIFSSVIMCVMAQLIDNTFALAATNSGLGTMYDPVTIIAMFLLLYYVHYQAVTRSLRVITLLPNAVLDWAGHGARMSGYNDVFSSEEVESRTYGAVVSNTSMSGVRSIGAGLQSGSVGGGKPNSGGGADSGIKDENSDQPSDS